MAAVTKWYGNGIKAVMGGAVDLDTDTLKVMLVTSAYTPDQDVHDFRDDLGANEIAAGGGYAAGGATLTTKTLSYDATSNQARLDVDDVTWTNVTASFRYAIVYKARGGAAAADELILYIDVGAQTLAGVDFTLRIDPTGLAYVQAA